MPAFIINNKRKIKKTFAVLLSFLFFAAILFGNDPLKINTALADGTWFNDGSGTAWSNRFKITPASVNSDLYYDLSLAPASFWSNVRSDGGDIRVTAQDGTTQLAREVSGFVKSDVAKVTTSGSGGDFYSPAMPVTAGQNYVLSMDVKWVSGSCPFLGLSYDNGVVDWKIGRISSGAVVDIDRVSTDWQHLEYSFTMPAASNARMSIEAYSGEAKSDSGNTEIHFKNIALTPGAVSSNGSGFAGWTNPGTQGNLFELTQSGAGSLFIGGLAATNNVFLPSDVPSASPTDGPYELGMIFSSDVAGYITKLRYYRQTGDTVSHDGHLWNSIGTLLATAAFPASSNVGWQSVALASPIAITANTNYTVSYSIDAGTPEPRTGSYFTAQKDSGHLHAPINAGVYTVTMGQFPTSSYLSGNYFADVDFSTKAIPDTSFYVYYGNPSATEPAAGSTYGKYNVWESAAKLVAHMEDANDSTVNQNNGTIANAYPVTADAKVNKGYQYNAANYNYINIGDKASLDFTTGFTIGGWIYRSGNFIDGAILGKINGGFPFDGYMLWTGASVSSVVLYIDQGGRISTGALSDNAWHRIIATWNGAQLNMYVDGTPVTPVNYNTAPTSSGKSFIIGGYSSAALNNLLDEAIIYDRPWSAQEVTTDYANQNDPATFWTTGGVENLITAIGATTGTPTVGSVLTAGALTPGGATVSYQWYDCTTSSSASCASSISGATSTTYTLQASDLGKYIAVTATGTGNYTGSVTSTPVGIVTTALTAIGATTGSASVGSVLTAGSLTPGGATATYQWYDCTTSDSTSCTSSISGATSSTYTLQASDLGKYIAVIATGTGSYTGSVTSTPVGIVTTSLTMLAGYNSRFLITPASVNSDLYYDLSLAPASFWANVRSDGGDIRVTAQDGTTQVPREVSGFDYAGHKGSLFIGTSGGTAFYIYYGNPAATEPAANSAYGKYNVWESAAKLVAHLEDMNDSTVNQNNGSSATPPSFVEEKLKNGGSFDGTNNIDFGDASSLNTAGVSVTLLAWIYPTVNNTYQAIIAKGAAARDYGFWLSGNGESEIYTAVGGIDQGNIALSVPWAVNAWNRVGMTVDGTKVRLYVNGQFSGSKDTALLTTASVSHVGVGLNFGESYPFHGDIDEARIYLNRVLSPNEFATDYANQNEPASFWTTGGAETAIGATTGTPTVGSVLTAGALTPGGATVSYQWYDCTTSSSASCASSIGGATSSAYTLQASDLGKYIAVIATGTGSYTGSVTSTPVGIVTTSLISIGATTGSASVGSVLTAGALTPGGATVSYQWYDCTTSASDSCTSSISGATSSAYTLQASDLGKYIAVTATGTGSYTGSVTSTPVGIVTTSLISIGATTGSASVGSVLTAGALTPSGAAGHVTYQWYDCTTSDSTSCTSSIGGATSSTYTLQTNDLGKYVAVTATGTGNYTGSVTSTPVGMVDDLTAPVTTASMTTSSGSYSSGTWINQNVTINLSCADPESGCLATYYCDDSSTCTDWSVYSVPQTISSNGTTTFRYYSTNNAGAAESVKSQTIKVDKTTPTTSDNFAKNGVWIDADPTITLYPATNDISGLAWTRYCEDTANTCDPSQGTDYNNTPVLIAPVSTPSTSYFRYASADNAGNTQTTVSLTVMIDRSPQVTQVLINPVNVSSPPTASASVTITNEGRFNYEYEYAWCVVTGSNIPCNSGGVYINGADSRDIFYGSNAKNINAGDDFITTLSATVPTAGTYYFEVVTYYDANQSSSAFQQFTIGSSAPAPTYTLTYTAGTGGTISGSSPQTVNSGSSGTAVTAVPDTGYTFLNWSDGVTTASRTDTDIIRNIPVTANFAIDTYTLTYSAGAGGTISGATTQTVNYGSSGSAVTAVPPSGYSFAGWSDGLTQNPRTDTNVNQNITVTANFTAAPAPAPSGGGYGGGGGAPIVTGTYDAAAARANNPDFNTDMNLPAAPSFTAWCVSGSLIKGSFPAVYYCGADGKRYVFVNGKSYFSWYPDFSTVKTIADETLALIPLGGNVTYRPGVRLVKIQSDPKVYAIARGGVLRWIMTEAIAARLFGANWNKMIDDIPDSFFVNYKIGAPITQ